MTSRLTGRQVLFILLGFFGTIVLVNAVMVTLALDTWSGLYEEQPYQKGLAYNQTIADARAQDGLGWHTRISSGGTAADFNLALEVRDRAGHPVSERKVSAKLWRPVGEARVLVAALGDAGPGHYQADLRLPLAGNWEVEIVVAGPDRDYVVRERLWVR